MPLIATVTVVAGTVFLVAWSIWEHRGAANWRKLIFSLSAVMLYLVLLRVLFKFPNFSTEYSKGDEDNSFLALSLAMYVCMLLGMGAEYLYHYFDPSEGTHEFSLGALLRPFFISPLVFMPLAASLQSANLDLSRFDAPRLMVFLVAFENGFLWRGYFSRKLASSKKTNARGPHA